MRTYQENERKAGDLSKLVTNKCFIKLVEVAIIWQDKHWHHGTNTLQVTFALALG